MQFTTNKRAIKKCILTSRIQIRSCSLSHKDILLNHREQFLVLKHGNQKNKHFGHSSHYLISLCHSTENKLKKWCELVSCTSHNPQQHKGQAKKKKKKQHSLLSLSLSYLPPLSCLLSSDGFCSAASSLVQKTYKCCRLWCGAGTEVARNGD